MLNGAPPGRIDLVCRLPAIAGGGSPMTDVAAASSKLGSPVNRTRNCLP
jgi:hypothetical protein